MTFRVEIGEFRERVTGPPDEETRYRSVSSAKTLDIGDKKVMYREVSPPESQAIVQEHYIRVQGWIEEFDGTEAVLRGIKISEADRVVTAMKEGNLRTDTAAFLSPDQIAYVPTRNHVPVSNLGDSPDDADTIPESSGGSDEPYRQVHSLKSFWRLHYSGDPPIQTDQETKDKEMRRGALLMSRISRKPELLEEGLQIADFSSHPWSKKLLPYADEIYKDVDGNVVLLRVCGEIDARTLTEEISSMKNAIDSADSIEHGVRGLIVIPEDGGGELCDIELEDSQIDILCI